MSERLLLHAGSALAGILLVTVLGLILLGGLSGVVLGLPPGVTYNRAHTWTIYLHNSSPDDPQRIHAVVDQTSPVLSDTTIVAAEPASAPMATNAWAMDPVVFVCTRFSHGRNAAVGLWFGSSAEVGKIGGAGAVVTPWACG